MKLSNLILGLTLILTPNILSAQKELIDRSSEKGYAENGVKVGKWEYYGSNKELELIVDYDSSKVDFYKTDTALYYAKLDSNWQLVELQRPLRYLGSLQNIYDYFAYQMAGPWPSKAKRKRIEAYLILEFTFDEKADISAVNVVGENKEYFADKLLEAAKDLPKPWMAAVYNNEVIPAKIAIPFIFEIDGIEKAPTMKDSIGEYNGKLLSAIHIKANF